MPIPEKEHQWLMQLVGEWEIEGEGTMGPDQPPMTWKGIESVRALGDYWTIGEGRGPMDSGEMVNITTYGYDPAKGRFVGSFISSVMTMMWLYQGSLDAGGKVLTLDTEGPGMGEEGKTARYQDIVEMIDHDHRLLRSQVLGDDGQWHQFMVAHYRRVK
ncbi:MAG: DUF1579 domain-containing protein [Armatimonadota bacterium]